MIYDIVCNLNELASIDEKIKIAKVVSCPRTKLDIDTKYLENTIHTVKNKINVQKRRKTESITFVIFINNKRWSIRNYRKVTVVQIQDVPVPLIF